MRQMKDSGIEWIGEIPENWSIFKLKHCAELSPKCDFSKLSDDSIIEYLPMEYVKNGSFVSNTAKYAEVSSSLTPFEEGDIIFAKVTPCFENGNTAILKNISSGVGFGSSELFVVRPQNIDTVFLFYWLQNKGFVNAACSTMTGTGGLKRVSPTFVRNSCLVVPPLPEQQAISAHLDKQCAHIDNIIEKTKASIEEYKKLRQAVITQAVTKGMRGDRPMKDSGIEWIGEIPEEWEVLKFKYIATVKSNLVHPTEYQDYMQVAPDNIEKGTGKLLECKTVGEVGVESDNHLFFKGQIVYSKIRPILNKVIIAPFDGLCSADMYPIETTINKYFLVYMMLSDRFLAQVKLVTENRVKMPKINQEELSQILIYLPPENEQNEIAAYLDKKCTEIDSLISKKEQFLSELESYKKSMIYEYVTGKKEVPTA